MRLARRVSEEVTGAKAPSYNSILELDRQIRSFDIPDSIFSPNDNGDTHLSIIKRWTVLHLREASE